VFGFLPPHTLNTQPRTWCAASFASMCPTYSSAVCPPDAAAAAAAAAVVVVVVVVVVAALPVAPRAAPRASGAGDDAARLAASRSRPTCQPAPPNPRTAMNKLRIVT
jgi:hypothetical protein